MDVYLCQLYKIYLCVSYIKLVQQEVFLLKTVCLSCDRVRRASLVKMAERFVVCLCTFVRAGIFYLMTYGFFTFYLQGDKGEAGAAGRDVSKTTLACSLTVLSSSSLLCFTPANI